MVDSFKKWVAVNEPKLCYQYHNGCIYIYTVMNTVPHSNLNQVSSLTATRKIMRGRTGTLDCSFNFLLPSPQLLLACLLYPEAQCLSRSRQVGPLVAEDVL